MVTPSPYRVQRRLLAMITTLALSSVVLAQTYTPNFQTRLEVNEAAAFTDGIVTPCPEAIRNSYTLCVDTSSTGWSQVELSDWADYGLSSWRIFGTWHRTEEGDLRLQLLNPPRNEIMVVTIIGNQFVTYLVGNIDDWQ